MISEAYRKRYHEREQELKGIKAAIKAFVIKDKLISHDDKTIRAYLIRNNYTPYNSEDTF